MNLHKMSLALGLGIVVSAVAVNAAEVTMQLTPLASSHALAVAPSSQSTVPFLVTEDQRLTIWVDSDYPIDIAVRKPDGTLLLESSQDTNFEVERLNGFDSELSNALLGQRVAVIATISQPALGWHQLVLISGPEPTTALARIEGGQPNVRGALMAGDGTSRVTEGDSATVAAFLNHNGSPLSGAEVILKVFRDLQFVQQLALVDSGTDVDFEQGDGVYSGHLIINEPGTYDLEASLSGLVANVPFHGKIREQLVVSAPSMKLTGQFSDREVDYDANGYINAIQIRFETDGPKQVGDYRLTATLKSPEGHEISAGTNMVAESGFSELDFPIEKLNGSGGPFEIAEVSLWRDGFPVSSVDHVGFTNQYDTSSFARPNTLLTGLLDEAANDFTGDGYFDALTVTIGVNVLKRAQYGISAELRTPSGQIIDSTGIASRTLSIGDNSVQLRFSTARLVEFKEDGPYVVRNALVYSHSAAKSSAYSAVVGQTREYGCEQFFEVCVVDPVKLLERLIADVESLGLPNGIENSLVAKLRAARNGLGRENAGGLHAPARQIGAFISEVDALTDVKITQDRGKLLVRSANLILVALD